MTDSPNMNGMATPDTSTDATAQQLAEAALTCRAEQVGSLLRPARLLSARRVRAEGRLSEEGLRELEDHLILESLREQREIGLDVYTDGQLRRSSWLIDIADAVDGFVEATTTEPGVGVEDRGGEARRVIGAPLRQRGRLTHREADFLRAHAPGPFKITLPSPSSLALATFEPGTTDQVYGSWEQLLADLSTLIASELSALVSDGTPYLQLDAPGYAFFADEGFRERRRAEGTDPDALLAQAIAADNACVAELPHERVTLGIHLCRGSASQHWLSVDEEEAMAEQLFTSLAFDVFMLESETEWRTGFRPLRFFGGDTKVVLGLVPTRRAKLASYPQLLGRIAQAAQHRPLTNLAVSPRCGFARSALGSELSLEDQRDKLQLVARLAGAMWANVS